RPAPHARQALAPLRADLRDLDPVADLYAHASPPPTISTITVYPSTSSMHVTPSYSRDISASASASPRSPVWSCRSVVSCAITPPRRLTQLHHEHAHDAAEPCAEEERRHPAASSSAFPAALIAARQIPNSAKSISRVILSSNSFRKASSFSASSSG